MKQIRNVKSLAFPLVLSALFVSALAYPGDSAVTLRRKFKQGMVEKYTTRMDVKMTMSGMPGKSSSQLMNMITTSNVSNTYAKVDRLGQSAQLTMKSSKTTLKMVPDMSALGQSASTPKETTTTLTIDSRGRTSNFKMDAATKAGPMGPMLSGMTDSGLSAYLPEKPVRPGDSWTVPLPPQMAMFGMKSAGLKQTFLGEKTVNGKRVYQIQMDAHLPINGMKLPGTMGSGKQGAQTSDMMSKIKGLIDISGQTYILKNDCSLWSMKMVTKAKITFPVPSTGTEQKPTPPMNMDQAMTMTMTRTK